MKNIRKIKKEYPMKSPVSMIVTVIMLAFTIVLTSCKKFLDIPSPKDAATSSEMFSNDAIATSAITGIYSRMASIGSFSGDYNSVATVSGLSADELISYNTFLDEFYKNDITSNSFVVSSLWSSIFNYIYAANAILDGLNAPNGVTDATNKQLQGEAKFVRAFCYFNLVNLFGDVPLDLTTDYRINGSASKSTKEIIYNQITTDLIDAENLLSESYITTERIRPNKWAAKALLSRVYLYRGNWSFAIQKATEVINQNKLYSLSPDLNQVFLKNSNEAIWQLMPTAGSNTQEGALFILSGTPINVALSPMLSTSFETGDNRKSKWTNQFTNNTGVYYYPSKYKVQSSSTITEYSMVIRLAELYLIRAEAEAKQGQIELALSDLDKIRFRAGLNVPLPMLSQSQCLLEVEKQRYFELFSEWGHRWFDLKRTNRSSAVLASLKGSNWKETDILYPIPDDEIKRNTNMLQNPGY